MWIWRNSKNEIYTFKLFDSQRCAICGQYFRKGETAIGIVPPRELRIHKKFALNLSAHHDCWKNFVGDITDDKVLAERYLKHRVPRPRALSEDEAARLDAFERAAYQRGFTQKTKKPFGVRMTRYRSSLYVEYDVHRDSIESGHRGKSGLWDKLYERQIITNVYNTMHEILNDGKHDNYSACEVIRKAQSEVDKMFH